MNIADLIPCPRQDGSLGVEIEIEADNLPSAASVTNYWRLERDASLRGESGEYVLRAPLSETELGIALSQLKSAMDKAGTKIRPTYRAGIHVHVNVQDLTPKQLITFISSYFMLEEVLLSFCDKTRAGNHFCLRMSDASYTLDMITEAILSSNLQVLDTEDLRYASLNITSLFKYGSVEFRALESTIDFEKVKAWAGVLNHLKEFAKTMDSPVDLLGRASERGFETFARDILGPHYKTFGKFVSEEKIRVGVRNIQYAVYSRDWSATDLNIFNKNKNLFSS